VLLIFFCGLRRAIRGSLRSYLRASRLVRGFAAPLLSLSREKSADLFVVQAPNVRSRKNIVFLTFIILCIRFYFSSKSFLSYSFVPLCERFNFQYFIASLLDNSGLSLRNALIYLLYSNCGSITLT
jgi:hypothetical protein